MRIVVTSSGPNTDDAVDPRFGRAAYLVLVDTDTEEATSHSNEANLQASQGAGVQTAGRAAELGADAVVTGNIGPKAYATLQAAGLAVHVGASGSVREALEKFQAGELAPANGPTVDGHVV